MNTTETLNTTTDGGITLTLLDVEDHFNIVNSVLDEGFTIGTFGKHEFIRTKPWTAIPVIVILSAASFVGTAGNILTLLAIASNKKLRNAEMIFIVNLAISDLYVTAIADPLSIVAKLEGEHFFDQIPLLCQIVGSLCTVSCVTSLVTIAAMSLNRYIYVCRSDWYKVIFSKRNCVITCCSLYCIGLTLVLLNQAGIGDHNFDRKSLECIWNRMANFTYTVVFSVTLVWIPCLTIGVCYLRLFLFVRDHRKKILKIKKDQAINRIVVPTVPAKPKPQLAKTFILIYAVFTICWAPYALIIVLDIQDSFPHELHLYITVFAHLHPSINWLIYYFTHRKISQAYCKLLGLRKRPINETSNCYTTRPDTLDALSEGKRNVTSKRAADDVATGRETETHTESGQRTHPKRLQSARSIEHSENGQEDSGIDCIEGATTPPLQSTSAQTDRKAILHENLESIKEQSKPNHDSELQP